MTEEQHRPHREEVAHRLVLDPAHVGAWIPCIGQTCEELAGVEQQVQPRVVCQQTATLQQYLDREPGNADYQPCGRRLLPGVHCETPGGPLKRPRRSRGLWSRWQELGDGLLAGAARAPDKRCAEADETEPEADVLADIGPVRGRAAASVPFAAYAAFAAATQAAYAVRSTVVPSAPMNCSIAQLSVWADAALTPGPKKNPRAIATTGNSKSKRSRRRGSTLAVTVVNLPTDCLPVQHFRGPQACHRSNTSANAPERPR